MIWSIECTDQRNERRTLVMKRLHEGHRAKKSEKPGPKTICPKQIEFSDEASRRIELLIVGVAAGAVKSYYSYALVVQLSCLIVGRVSTSSRDVGGRCAVVASKSYCQAVTRYSTELEEPKYRVIRCS